MYEQGWYISSRLRMEQMSRGLSSTYTIQSYKGVMKRSTLFNFAVNCYMLVSQAGQQYCNLLQTTIYHSYDLELDKLFLQVYLKIYQGGFILQTVRIRKRQVTEQQTAGSTLIVWWDDPPIHSLFRYCLYCCFSYYQRVSRGRVVKATDYGF